MILMILKIFWSSIQHVVPDYMCNNENMGKWFEIFLKFLHESVPSADEDEDTYEIDHSPHWLIKKWVSKILERIFTTYATARPYDSDSQKQFAHNFMENYVVPILESTFSFLNNFNGTHIPKKVLTFCILYIQKGILYAKTWTRIKPYLPMFFNSFLYPILCMDEFDIHLFMNDPIEYVNREFDVTKVGYDPRAAGLSFVRKASKHREEEILDIFMQTIMNEVLPRYTQEPSQHATLKEASLSIIGCIAEPLIASKYRSQLPEFLATHVFPDLRSEIPYIRSKAIWTFSCFSSIEFNNNMYESAIQSLLDGFNSNSMAVKMHTAIALQHFVEVPLGNSVIGKVLPQIIDEFFKIIEISENEELMVSLKDIIHSYTPVIHNYSVSLMNNLIKKLEQLMSLTSDDLLGKGFACVHICNSICILLHALKESPDLNIYYEMESILLPLLLSINENFMDLFESVTDIFNVLVQNIPTVSQNLWKVFDICCDSYMEWAYDSLSDIIVPFKEMIRKDPQGFVQGAHLEKVCMMFQTLFENTNSEEYECGEIAKLVEVMFLSCRGLIDSVVTPILDLALSRYESVYFQNFKITILNLVLLAMYYNPVLTFNYLESNNSTDGVLGIWDSLTNSFKQFDFLY
eukprot:TRINITY_DN5215_c0_g1_i2.p1 TRINITY_DN5215_c0_g1~~TRINITY_DN5215_c0_g1_i2.p1  ORF type:complete len:632 (-),score=131.67 TRINITY_DN5215_c0_g1_i2:371-2266(-)